MNLDANPQNQTSAGPRCRGEGDGGWGRIDADVERLSCAVVLNPAELTFVRKCFLVVMAGQLPQHNLSGSVARFKYFGTRTHLGMLRGTWEPSEGK